MKFILIFSFCVFLIGQVVDGIVLHDIEVPELVKVENDDNDEDENEPIKLDCNYELNEHPSYLVVKWFMNDNSIYQWIRGQKPSVLPYFKHHIGEIEPTSSDPNYEYRGLTLINPSIELSGIYRCLVQTDRESRSMEKPLHVVDISNSSIVFENHPVQNETHLECTVTNIFPRPRIHLVSNDENIILSSNITNVEKLPNDYFNASMTAVAQNTDDDPDAFSCFVTFEGLNLNLTANTIRSGCGKTSIISSYVWYLVCIVFSLKLFNYL